MAVSYGSRQSDSKQSTRPSKKSNKFGSAFKKVGHYLQNQAQEQSHSALYLSPAENTHAKQRQLDDDYPSQNLQASHLARPYGTIPPLSSNNITPQSSNSMTTNDVAGSGIFQKMVRHQYASDNILQSYDVLVPFRPSSSNNDHADADESGYFLVFIHGGYFRDPKITSASFKPAISALESNPDLALKITGYASINYRLAPHPAYPQDSSTPSYMLNNARWPDQPNDILSALKHIQSAYPRAKRYIFAGHSVGATLAFLAILRSQASSVTPPCVVVGVTGIYDFPKIHVNHPEYEDMTRNAMDKARYIEASPASYNVDRYRKDWDVESQHEHREKRGVILAHSRTDGLLDWDQAEIMQDVFRRKDPTEDDQFATGFDVELVELKGGHYEVLENGELARALTRAVEMAG